MTRSPRNSAASVALGLGLTLFAALAAKSQSAHADIPPPDGCLNAGDTCTNAGPHATDVGTCVASTCSRMFRSDDGTFKPVDSACNKCVAGTASATASSASDAGSATSAATAVPPVQPAQKSGCNAGGSAPVPLEVAFGLAAALLVLPRKKSTTR